MRIALFADIHANRQAFAACLAHARGAGADRVALLGDYVGYGADPEWSVATVMGLVADGAVAVQNGRFSQASRCATRRMAACSCMRRRAGRIVGTM